MITHVPRNAIQLYPEWKTANASVIPMPTNCAYGGLGVRLKGITATNIVENGDFSNGTTGWAPLYGTLSATGGILTVTGNGAQTTPAVYSPILLNPYKANDVIFVRIRVRVTNDVCTRIRIGLIGDATLKTQDYFSPVINEWYTRYFIATNIADIANIRLYVYHWYADMATANGKVMEVDTALIINSTEAGLGSKTVDEMNEAFPSWFDGTQDVKDVKVWSARKNLSRVSTVTVSAQWSGGFASKISTFNGTQDLTFSYTTDNPYRKALRIYDSEGNEITTGDAPLGFGYDAGAGMWKSGVNISAESGSFTLPARADIAYVEFGIGNWETTPIIVTDMMVEYGSSATAYEVCTLGQNLFDGELESGAISTSTGQNSVDPTYTRSVNATKIIPNTQYTFNNHNSATDAVVFYYDADMNYIDFLYNNKSFVTFTTPADACFVRFRIGLASLEQQNQLNEGATALPYEAYVQKNDNDFTLPVAMDGVKRLPNGTADVVSMNEGKVEQKVSDVYTLQVSDVISLNTAPSGVDTVYIRTLDNQVVFIETYTIQGATIIPDWVEVGWDGGTSAMVGKHITNSASNIIGFNVAKGTYADLAAAQAGLAGTKVRYELAEPISHTIPDCNPVIYSGGAIHVEPQTNVMLPTLEYNHPVQVQRTKSKVWTL